MTRRVVVTGLGVVAPNGNNLEDFWANIKAGKSAVAPITKFDSSRLSVKMAAEVKDFDPSLHIDKREMKRMDLFCQYAVAASMMAVENASLDTDSVDSERFGVLIGVGLGGLMTFEKNHQILLEKGPRRISPLFIPMMIPNMASGMVSIMTGAKGVNECVVTACSSGNNAIGNAFRFVESGEMDIMICGGAEAAITELALGGFNNMKAVSFSEDPNRASIPFDKERDGFVMGEGSGILIIEAYDHAVARGAEIVAEIKGFASTSDAFHMTAPAENGEGGARAMKHALEDAGFKPEDIDYINAHGTSTYMNDLCETQGMKSVFKDHSKNLWVSSTKSMTGHLLGAAGGVESVFSLLAIKNSVVPPTINYETPDPECDLDYVPNTAREKQVGRVMSNSFGFGGTNATLIFQRFDG
ncbi:MAG: beta-ketoacyl-ACP synthase II [Clostridia bacterium]|nr:beta-ketoacyl-ACP synthase II [Clostridia bacterium]